jgi:hypothetical protein
MKKNLIPLLGVLFSALLAMAAIHFWLADLYSALTGISRRAAYAYLTVLLVCWSGWRVVRIVKGKDEITDAIDKWMGK